MLDLLQRVFRRRGVKVACAVVAMVFAAAMLMAVTVATRARNTCTLCRAERTDRTLFGFRWSRFQDNEFSNWYRVHRPAHEHMWGRLTCTRGFTVFGTTTYFACGRRHPVCELSPAVLREFVERAETNTLTTYFDGIVSTNEDVQRQTVRMVWDRVLDDK